MLFFRLGSYVTWSFFYLVELSLVDWSRNFQLLRNGDYMIVLTTNRGLKDGEHGKKSRNRAGKGK